MTTSESSYRGSTIAATFPDRGSANKALTDLHHAGFRTVWLGVIHGDAKSSAGATVESDAADGGLMGSLGKFFSGGASDEIRISLSEERIDVQKRTVVTEDVAIGKRQVAGSEHISATVRHEELRVYNDTNVPGTARAPVSPNL